MWLHDIFDFEHLICVIFSLIAYSPVYAVAKFFMRKKVPQKLIFRIIIMIIVGYATLSIRYFVLGFLGIDATIIWFFSLYCGWHLLFKMQLVSIVRPMRGSNKKTRFYPSLKMALMQNRISLSSFLLALSRYFSISFFSSIAFLLHILKQR